MNLVFVLMALPITPTSTVLSCRARLNNQNSLRRQATGWNPYIPVASVQTPEALAGPINRQPGQTPTACNCD